jgi:site-specific recombinase XerD
MGGTKMTNGTLPLAPLIQRFFADRLMKQKQASPHTICSYRDTFRLLLTFLDRRLRRPPARLTVDDLDAPLIASFLNELENERRLAARTRNLRLTAIRSFFRYLSFELPERAAQIQRILAIPAKREPRPLVSFLNRKEADALLHAADQSTWLGRRNHALLLLGMQTGLRLSELTGVRKEDLTLEGGANVRVVGKGRKERCTPLAKRTVTVLRKWLQEPSPHDSDFAFPSAHGTRLSSDAVQFLLRKHVASAARSCPSLAKKRVSPHVLRHYAAMELLQAGVDRAVIALWLGHESVETTQIYLQANLEMKEAALAKVKPSSARAARYKPNDSLLEFLKNL